jgi:hypothetical protein
MEQVINPYEFLKKILSKEGFSNDYFSISFEDSINLFVSEIEDGIKIFFNSKPKLKLKKYLRLTLTVSGIILNKDGGILTIDSFPDIPFKYDWILK